MLKLVARRGYGVLFGREVPADTKDTLKKELPKGAAAVKRLSRFSPWIAGGEFTYADLFGYWTFLLANESAKQNAGIDLLAEIPGAAGWYDRVTARPAVAKAIEERNAALKARRG